MNFSRHRNIFTLGSQENSKRRPTGDVFEKDPFKIQSYNFRYADRPIFPMVVSPKRPNNRDNVRDCQTYFYNYDFSSTKNLNTVRDAAFHSDKRAQNLTKFQQYRRRKFLNDTGSSRNSELSQGNSSNLNRNSPTSKISKAYDEKITINTTHASLRKINHSSTLDQMANSKSSLTKIKSRASDRVVTKPESPKHSLTSQPPSSMHQSMGFDAAGISINPGRGLGSSCEININFKNLAHSSQHENVNIKIKTDSVCKNLNIPQKPSNATNQRVEKTNSSASFVIDKRLSKFASNQDRQSSRAKEVTSIYSSDKFPKTSTATHMKSFERLPSLIPFKSSDSKRNISSSFSKENFASKQSSLVPKAKNNLSVCHNKAPERSYSQNNLNRSSYYMRNGGPKLSESSSLTSKQNFLNKLANAQGPPMVSSMHSLTSSSSLRIDKSKSMAPIRLRKHARLPVNVNINVFADKLKLLKV